MDAETKQAFAALSTHVSKEIADLALNVKLGFDETDRRFNEMDRKTSERFNKIDTRIDTLYKNVDGFINLHQTLTMELAATRLQQGRLEERVEHLEARSK